MFYKQFSEITDILNPDFVDSFDYWLATLPKNRQKNITASMVSAKLEVKYSLAEMILKYAEKQKILECYYLIKCPECDNVINIVDKEELSEILLNPVIYCSECDNDRQVTTNDIYIAYKVIKQPDATEDQICHAIKQKLSEKGIVSENFIKADLLSNNIDDIYETFYNPGESAYQNLKELRKKLDLDYRENTTAKGRALELLVITMFNNIKVVRGTTEIKTNTNQFDCTVLCNVNVISLSIFNYLVPYFIIECKNEPHKKPDNTYCNKLESIMDTNEAQFGIIFGRMDATTTCYTISREHYLTHKDSNKHKIIITCSDKDLDYLIDKRVNLLKYLDYKIFCITAGSPNTTYEMYVQE